MTATIGITGTSGFIGGALLRYATGSGLKALTIPRDMLDEASTGQLRRQLAGCDAVVHCAALTPRRDRQVSGPEYDRVNQLMTRRIASCAADAGVARFVFLSSISTISGSAGVLGVKTPLDPVGAYGASKAKAEDDLMAEPRIQSLILRSPLVYGPGVRGDLRQLVRLCDTAIPLPFGAVHNRRSMVAITNLVDALRFLATSTNLAGPTRIFHVCDEQPLSLVQLVTEIRRALGRPARLVAIPAPLLRGVLGAVGLGAIARKLLGDIIVDQSDLLASGWSPRVGHAADLAAMARACRDSV